MAQVTASGILKQVRLAPETTFGVPLVGSSTSAQLLRRVSSDINPTVASYQSQEIQPSRQIHDFRHGLRGVQGQLKGELSPGTYASVFAGALAGTFTAGASANAAALGTVTATAAVVNTSPGTFTRSIGSFLTDGFKLGDLVRLTGMGTTGAANNNRNYRITGLTATVLSVGPVPTTANPSVGTEVVAAVAADAGTTIAVTGKKLVTPQPGFLLDNSFSLEHWFTDILQSELYLGCKPSQMAVGLPATGLGTIDTTFMGQNFVFASGAPYFTAPGAVSTSGITAAVNGTLRVAGADVALVTGINFTVATGMSTEAVVGSNLTPFVWPGTIDVKGTFTALFFDGTFRDYMVNETEISLHAYMTLSNVANPDFLSFFFPRIKLASAARNDVPKAIVGNYSFQALNNVLGGTGTSTDLTTLVIQDSLA
jgi:hypothetical protein